MDKERRTVLRSDKALRIGLVKVTSQIGVVSPAQCAKRYSRLRVEAVPTSAQSRNCPGTQAHKSPETILIPLGASFPHFAFQPHKQSHGLNGEVALKR